MKTSIIYVSGFPESMSESGLQDLLQPYGMIRAAQIVRHKHSTKSAGYGFVEMEDAQAREAIKALEGTLYQGQRLRLYLTPFVQGVDGDAAAV